MIKKILSLIILLLTGFFTFCGENKPLLSDLATSKLLVVFKGTYATNNPKPWAWPASPDDPAIQDDSVDDCTVTGVDTRPTTFMIDIADMKLVNTGGDKFDFSNLRQTLAFDLSDSNPFFNGTGYILDSNDVPSGGYLYLMIYVRAMLFDASRHYTGTASGWSPSSSGDLLGLNYDLFAERVVPGFNFNLFMLNTFYDTLRLEGMYINRVFPIIIPIETDSLSSSLIFRQDVPYTVLEVRLLVKNFIKKFERESTAADGVYTVDHYYALSDWLMDVQSDETALGGNIIAQARSYVPGYTGIISGNCTADRYVIAVPSGMPITAYTLPANPRAANACNFVREPAPYYGSSINQALDYYLKLERFKFEWNDRIDLPLLNATRCTNFAQYQTDWNTWLGEVGDFKLPPLATYATGNSYSLENVPPGTYDVYMSQTDGGPAYGTLFEDGQFANVHTVTVGIGSVVTQNFL